MSIRALTFPTKRLAAALTSTGSLLKVNSVTHWDGNAITAGEVGSVIYVVLRNEANTQFEIIAVDASTIALAATTGATITGRALGYTGGTTANAETAYDWPANETLVDIGTHPPQLFENFVDLDEAQTIGGAKTFSTVPATTGGDAASSNELVRYSQLLAAALGSYAVTPVVVPGKAGEALAVDQLVYLKASDNRWWLCDADTAGTVENVRLGITRGAAAGAGSAIASGVTIFGEHVASSALFVADTKYYASNTAGGFSTTPGTTEVTIGMARTTTAIILAPRFDQEITEDIQDALVGTSGTAPSASNKFVDNSDTSATGSGSKVPRGTSGKLDNSWINVKFGGTGADGALAVASGTTTIDLGGAAVVVKNYTSIAITGTGAIAFSNPHANGTQIILRSQGAVTLTSSTVPCIDASAMGAAGGAAVTNSANGNSGNNPTNTIFDALTHAGTKGLGGQTNGNGSGAGGVLISDGPFLTLAAKLARRSINLACGAGGASGGAGANGNGTSTGGAGGRGGGALLIECAGALNFTGTISVAGAAGSNGTATGTTSEGAGGGGGGAGGMCAILYNTLTANTGTINSAGGAGGSGAGSGSGAGGSTAGAGGGGAGSIVAAGGAGGSASNNPGGAGSAAGGASAGGGGGGGGINISSSGGSNGAAGASNSGVVAANDYFF